MFLCKGWQFNQAWTENAEDLYFCKGSFYEFRFVFTELLFRHIKEIKFKENKYMFKYVNKNPDVIMTMVS